MAVGRQDPDPKDIDPGVFARLVAKWDDDGLIVEGVRAVGIERMLDRVFDEMTQRLRADRVGDVEADVQWIVTHGDDGHAYVLRLRGGEAESTQGRADHPRVTFEVDLAAFARLITGNASPVKLVLTRRLKPRGDLLFARKVPTFFDMPTG